MNDLSTAHEVFNFGAHAVRVVRANDDPWFVAADVCHALELGNTTKALKALADDEKMTIAVQHAKTGTRGGAQYQSIVSESGLYTLVLRCRDAVKKGTVPYAFRRWVTSEVIPSLRKHGYHVGAPRAEFAVQPTDVLSEGQQETLRLMVKTLAERLPREKQGAATIKC